MDIKHHVYLLTGCSQLLKEQVVEYTSFGFSFKCLASALLSLLEVAVLGSPSIRVRMVSVDVNIKLAFIAAHLNARIILVVTV